MTAHRDSRDAGTPSLVKYLTLQLASIVRACVCDIVRRNARHLGHRSPQLTGLGDRSGGAHSHLLAARMRPAVVSVPFCLRGAAQHSPCVCPVSLLQVSSVGQTKQDFKTDIGDGRRSAPWGCKCCYPCRVCSSLALEILLPLCMQSPIPVSLPCTHLTCT